MGAVIIDGRILASEIETSLAQDIQVLRKELGRAPKLVVVLVGENPASQVYVKSKTKRAQQCGIDAEDICLPGTTSNESLQQTLKELSARTDIDGILLQLPLPKGLDEFAALLAIAPDKDVDGLHPYSQGLLLRGQKTFQPCTPKGAMVLIDKARKELSLDSNLSGLKATVVGRSILVGKPMGLLLLERHCTVSLCHSRTADLKAECRNADILIAAVGRPELLTGEYVKPGAIVIDVGINRVADKLVGDVHFDSAKEVAGAITPVPRGVGPMTIAMLLANTVDSAKAKIAKP